MAIRTVCDIFYHSVDTFRKAEHLKYKKDGAWRAISSAELRSAVEELSLGLRALGVEKGDKVAILSENRPEWAFADLATLALGAADVPVYATLTPAQVLYILNDSEAKVVLRLERRPGGQGGGGAGQLQHRPPRHPHGRGAGRGNALARRGARPGAGGPRPRPGRGAPARGGGRSPRTSPPSSTPRAPPATPRG